MRKIPKEGQSAAESRTELSHH